MVPFDSKDLGITGGRPNGTFVFYKRQLYRNIPGEEKKTLVREGFVLVVLSQW